MRKVLYTLFIIYTVALAGCKPKASVTIPVPTGHDAVTQRQATQIQYSQLLSLTDVEDYTLCRIRDPWRTDQIAKQYLLVPADDASWTDAKMQEFEASYGPSIVLRTPLTHVTLTTTCHAWLLSQLDALDHVAVMCDTAYVNAQNVRGWMRSYRADGKPMIADGGPSMSPNAEVIMAHGSDALWISPFQDMSLGQLAQLPVPIIYCADYLENSPLARAEWMKFYGRLVDKAEAADAMFEAVASRYEHLTEHQPKGQSLLAELPYGATWYVPGGASTSSLLYQDAGYDYPWSDDTHAGSLSLSREAVLAKAHDCDLWLIKYNDPKGTLTLASLTSQNPLYAEFKATKTHQVWACNTARSDFFDVTPFRPDTLLQSLMQMDGAFYQLLP